MSLRASATADRSIRRERMRIAGEPVDNARRIEVINPYTGGSVGSVPKATVEDVRRAFRIAAGYRSPLTRHDRAVILRNVADLIGRRKEEIADLITAESGLCRKDSLYEVGRATGRYRGREV